MGKQEQVQIHNLKVEIDHWKVEIESLSRLLCEALGWTPHDSNKCDCPQHDRKYLSWPTPDRSWMNL